LPLLQLRQLSMSEADADVPVANKSRSASDVSATAGEAGELISSQVLDYECCIWYCVC